MFKACIPSIKALESATITPAIILYETENNGQIKPGFYADIIVVAVNPDQQINSLEKVLFMIKDGVLYKQ